MSKITLDTTDMAAIGNAIRTKLAVETGYKAGDMPAAILSIPGGGITPTGTISIDSNGSYDVTQYASADVNVSGGGGDDDPFALTDYIESSGTQYIDTGYIIQSNTKLEAVCVPTIAGSQWPHIWGCRVNWRDNSCCLCIKDGTSSNGSFSWSNRESMVDDVAFPYSGLNGAKLCITASSGGVKFQTSNPYYIPAYTNPYDSTPVCPYSLCLFIQHSDGGYNTDTTIAMKLYRFRIFEGDTLVMELVPAINGDTVCMRDTVSGDYYYNAGTGAFTYGSDSV